MKGIIFIAMILCACKMTDKRGADYHDKCRPQESVHNVIVNTDYGSYETNGVNGLAEADMKYDTGAVAKIGKRWIGGVVPFIYDDGYKFKTRTKKALAEWTRATGGKIKFVPRTVERDYIKFISNDSGCWSYVGRNGGEQRLSISSSLGCPDFIVMHEVGHALGLLHEHTRQDRDDYVFVNWCNIDDDMKYNFMKADRNFSIDIGEYDILSIMHYPASLFSKNKYKTLQGVNGYRVPELNNRKITDQDKDAVLIINQLL